MNEKSYVKKFIEQPIKDNWNLPAFTDYKKETFTYAEVARKIARFHLMFEKAGVKKGDKIALIGKNSARWGIVYLSVISYGAVIVPILSDFHSNDIHHIVNHSDAVALFLNKNIWDKIDENKMPNLRAIISLDDFNILAQKKRENVKKAFGNLDKSFEKKYGKNFTKDKVVYNANSKNELASIVYTSGTTGFSKGVMLPYQSLYANVNFAWQNMKLEAGYKTVSFLPLAHSFGCAFDFLWPFSRGVHIHFLSRIPTPQIILKAFAEVKPDIIFAVPLILEKIYKKQILPILNKKSVNLISKVPILNSVVYKKIKDKLDTAFGGNFSQIILGGAPLSKEVNDFLKKIKFRYTVGYGMTECGPLISYNHWSTTKSGSAGKIITPLTAKIDSDNPQKKAGEIMVKGANVMLGYYKNKEATEKVLDSNGWLHTGDLGVLDKDNFVYIRGRNKSMILGPSGENIYPEEIEAVINNMPLVQESVVVDDQNNKLVALIYPDYEDADKQGLSDSSIEKLIKDLRTEINNNLPRYKQISRIQIYPNEFEKTPKKSIKRFLYHID